MSKKRWVAQVDIYGIVGKGDTVYETKRTKGLNARVFVIIPSTGIKTDIDELFFEEHFKSEQ